VITPVSAAYNFTSSGVGNYSIKPSNLFTHVGVGGTPKEIYATVEEIAEVRLSGNLAVSRVLDKRESARLGCSDMRTVIINGVIEIAHIYVDGAIGFIDAMNRADPPLRWTTWFGRGHSCRITRIRSVFWLMQDHDVMDGEYGGIRTVNFDCNCNRPDVVTYSSSSVYIFQSWVIRSLTDLLISSSELDPPLP